MREARLAERSRHFSSLSHPSLTIGSRGPKGSARVRNARSDHLRNVAKSSGLAPPGRSGSLLKCGIRGEGIMRYRLADVLAILGVTLLFAAVAGVTQATDPDWKAVEQALGNSGQLQAGDVFRVGMPRTDLSVTVKGVPVKAGFALGSYAAFKQLGDQAMVMGDLVLLDQEVPGVMAGLFRGGLDVTAVHNHLNEMSPHVMYMHYGGHGEAVKLATALRQALSASGTPLGGGGSAAAAPAAGPGLDTKQIEQALGRTGRALDGGVFQVTVPRAEVITEMGVQLLPAMGVTTVMNFQPTADGKAAIP